MTQIKDKVVAITGAASGIGRALALRLAAKGARLAISDVNESGLRETATLLAATASDVSVHVVDVRRRQVVQRYAEEVERQHGGADIVINNAGLAVRASLEEVSYQDFETVIDVNLWGVIHGTKAFLPLLRKRAEGHIVNISSINAMVPFINNGPYNISKYAVLGLSETLIQELQGQPIHVTCVHPGGIRTDIVRNCKGATEGDVAMFEKLARTSPREAADAIIAGIEKNKEQVFIGVDAKAMAVAKRLFPRWVLHRTATLMHRLEKKRT
ncbi:MAG: SDR family NAD(P)-dependent oxidoreductase [Myxococcota bacterium]|nr:SDR family NAD(P)-dependent oxidoreductase [Myxococcota bacterium]